MNLSIHVRCSSTRTKTALYLFNEKRKVMFPCIDSKRLFESYIDKSISFFFRQGFGKADHEESKRILATEYADYEIEWSDAGY